MRELTCICCPRGCRLKVDEQNGYAVSGNHCQRGAEYGYTECTHPTRTLTSSVPVLGGDHVRVSVKTAQPIDKDKLFAAMEVVRALQAQAPVELGQVLAENIAGSGVDLIACRAVKKLVS